MDAEQDEAAAADPSTEDVEDLREELRSIASIDLEQVSITGHGEDRVLLGEVAQHDAPEEVTVVVQLTWGEQTVRGLAQGGTSEHSIMRTAAQATLSAVDSLLPPGRAALHVDWLEVLGPPTPNRPTVLHCSIAFRTAAGEDLLVGSAVVRDDLPQAAVRATLDAVNRRLKMLLDV